MKKLTLLFLIFFTAFYGHVSAQTVTGDTSVVIQPSKIEVAASPEQKVSRSFTVINRSNFNVTLKLIVKDYKQASTDGKLNFYDATSEPASSWIVPQYLQVALKPLESKDIGVVINVPKDFSAGGHYGAILFQSAGAVNVNTYDFGELFLLTVSGSGLKTNAIAKTINFSTTGIQQGNPVDFSFTMQNTGNTHFETSGKLVLKDWMGKEVGNYNIGQLILYPNTSRSFKWRWSGTPLMGMYRANVMLVDPSSANKELKLVDGVWFLLFPWKASILVLLAGLVIFAVVRYRNKIFSTKTYKSFLHIDSVYQ